ncbi:MAG: hypothetical protein WC557_01050 [Ignavibacteriaceae bacterium]
MKAKEIEVKNNCFLLERKHVGARRSERFVFCFSIWLSFKFSVFHWVGFAGSIKNFDLAVA